MRDAEQRDAEPQHVREENSIPATQRPSSCRKWNAMPNNSANSMTGAV